MKNKTAISIVSIVSILVIAITIVYGQTIWNKFWMEPEVSNVSEVPLETSIDTMPELNLGQADVSVEERQAALEALEAESGTMEVSRKERSASLQALEAEAGIVDTTTNINY